MMSKLDRLMMLQEEVKIAKKFVEEHGPEDMGYVHTAKDYIQNRADDLKAELTDEYGFNKDK